MAATAQTLAIPGLNVLATGVIVVTVASLEENQMVACQPEPLD